MQIRVQGQQVQLIRSPYDAIKKRCVQKVVHTFQKHDNYLSANIDDYLSDEQREDLSSEEKQLLHSWLRDRFYSHQANERKESIRLAYANIVKTSAAILADGIEDENAQSIYEAIDILRSALKKKGHKKNKPLTSNN